MEDDSHSWMELYLLLVFLLVVWLSGKIAALLRAPDLVGYIIAGIVFGPHVLDLAPKVSALKLVGQVGLLLLVAEAGIDVDLAMLRLVGARSCLVGVLGSMVPLGIGFLIASQAVGLSTEASFVVGASLAPTSAGISLQVLRSGRMLQTPIGQLIIAAAILDDVIALVLISELDAIGNPKASNFDFVKPVLIALALLVGFGLFAVYLMPSLLDRFVYRRFKEERHGNLSLAILFSLVLVLAPFARYVGSSPLLGSFIAGLCFCTSSKAKEAWNKQVKRIGSWLLRLFFACSIGFEVPVELFGNPSVILRGLLFLTAVLGKLATGVWAKPLTKSNAAVVGLAMSSYGELAFVVSVESRARDIITEEVFASIIFAILVSIMVAPVLLGLTIRYFVKPCPKPTVKADPNRGIDDGHGGVKCSEEGSTAAHSLELI